MHFDTVSNQQEGLELGKVTVTVLAPWGPSRQDGLFVWVKMHLMNAKMAKCWCSKRESRWPGWVLIHNGDVKAGVGGWQISSRMRSLNKANIRCDRPATNTTFVYYIVLASGTVPLNGKQLSCNSNVVLLRTSQPWSHFLILESSSIFCT